MSMSMQQFRRCKWEVDDDVHEAVKNGLVITNGPNVTLYRWNTAVGRYDQVDRLTKASRRDVEDGFVLEGISTFLVQRLQAKPADSRIVVHVVPRKNCETCQPS